MKDNRNVPRGTFAHRAVTALRFALTIPGRLGRAAITGAACWGGWEIGSVALKQTPPDKLLLVGAAIVFGFGAMFTFPETTVRTSSRIIGIVKSVRRATPPAP